MKPPFQTPTQNPEERFEAWLASQPLTPAPDFVARTLARIRAEAALVSSARAGNEAAIDALLDRWLNEQPLETDLEPAQLATQARRTAELEEREEARPPTSTPRWVVPFPTWARSTVALAAAACVTLLAYFGTNSTQLAKTNTTAPQVAQNNISDDSSDDSSVPAYYALNTDPKAILKLSDSLSDGEALLSSDNDNILLGNDGSVTDTATNDGSANDDVN